MIPLVGPAMAGAALLALAGALKLLDPTMTVGALHRLGLPSGPLLVRSGAGAELALGVLAIVVGGGIWWLVAASYLAFSVFVGLALGRRSPIGSCGCFGRADTPPRPRHLVLNLLLAAWAVAAARALDGSVLDELERRPAGGALAVVAAAVLLVVLHAVYTQPGPDVLTPAPVAPSETTPT